MVWNSGSFLEDIGLAPQSDKPYTKKKLHIDKGEIDPRSMGGISVISKAQFDKPGVIKDLDLSVWVIHPDGRAEKQHLIQIETEQITIGGKSSPRIDVKSIWILGRQVNLQNSHNVDNVLEAVRRIHVDLRDTSAQVPHIAKIFKDCLIEDVIGERLPLPGFDLDQRLYFPAAPNFNMRAQGTKQRPQMEIPLEAFMPLAGIRKNTLDTDHSYVGRDFLQARGVIPKIGKRFMMRSSLSKLGRRSKSRELKLTQSAENSQKDNNNMRVFVSARWKVEKAGKKRGFDNETARLKEISLLGHNTLRRGFHEVMGALGVLNRTHSDMLNARDYPHMQDHLATYGLLDVATTSSVPPDKEGRFIMTSIGGNNLREIYPGIGEDIGGNCKTAETHWLDSGTGEEQKIGVILDLGSYLIKQHSEWSAGHPDVVEKLKYCKDIFITHHHLDHKDGLIPYIKRSLLSREHTIHMTPEVYEMLHDKLTNWGIKKDDPRRPQINFLEGTGVVDIKDEKGIKRLSVMYSVDAVSHSGRDTPFIAYGRNGDEILGSYMYLGDMRYDEDWFAIHDSLFWDPVKVMLEREPHLNPDHLTPTYTELDGTSIKREGRGASEKDVEKNLTHIGNHWAPDKHIAIARIGTADGRRETELRAANNMGRKITAFGAAIEFHYRIANKHGVNPYRLSRPDRGKYTGIADFLKWHANENDIIPAEFKGRTSKAVKDWFENDKPGSIMAVLSGSQGNPIEFESMTYKLADGRSLWDADNKKSKTARPADLQDWVIIFSQGAIPGNAKYQRALIKRLAGRGACVLESFDDNLRVHNPGKKLKARILKDLIAQGRLRAGQEEDIIEAGGTILIENYSIHASGHGRKEDMRLWLHKLKVKLFGLCHTDDREAVIAGYDLIEQEGKKHPGRIFENGEEIQITNDTVTPIGKTISSIILTKEETEPGKRYNKSMKAMRVLNLDDRSPHHYLGLRGTVGGVFETAVGIEDIEDIRGRLGKKPYPEDTAIHSSLTVSKPRRIHEGLRPLKTPPWNPDHPAFFT